MTHLDALSLHRSRLASVSRLRGTLWLPGMQQNRTSRCPSADRWRKPSCLAANKYFHDPPHILRVSLPAPMPGNRHPWLQFPKSDCNIPTTFLRWIEFSTLPRNISHFVTTIPTQQLRHLELSMGHNGCRNMLTSSTRDCHSGLRHPSFGPYCPSACADRCPAWSHQQLLHRHVQGGREAVSIRGAHELLWARQCSPPSRDGGWQWGIRGWFRVQQFRSEGLLWQAVSGCAWNDPLQARSWLRWAGPVHVRGCHSTEVPMGRSSHQNNPKIDTNTEVPLGLSSHFTPPKAWFKAV